MHADSSTPRPCSVQGCERPHFSHGFCQSHSNRFRKYGDPLAGRKASPRKALTICSASGCSNTARTSGLCGTHYCRWQRHGDPNVAYRPFDLTPKKGCAVPGCERAHQGQGWCQLHYQRWKKTGDPLCVRPHTANVGSFQKGQAAHNKGKPGPPSPRRGIALTEDCKAKVSQALKAAYRAGLKPPNLGKQYAPETRQKIKEARARQVITPEHRAAISRGNMGKRLSPEHVAKLAGPNHYRWKGGTRRNLSRREWRELRAAVIERNEQRCRWCTRGGLTLIAHHVIPYDKGGPDALDNLIAVCRACHTRYHSTKQLSPV